MEAPRREAGRADNPWREARGVETSRWETDRMETKRREAGRMEAERGKTRGLETPREEAGRVETPGREAARVEAEGTQTFRRQTRQQEIYRPQAPAPSVALMLPNFEKMLRLADEFFSAKDDPSQLNVTGDMMERLKRIHPASLSDHCTRDGPVAWILLIPTTGEVMRRFLHGKIDENALLDLTPVPGTYDALYLCSALVLPEYRNRELALKVSARAVEAIRRDHPIRVLFYWEFSTGGKALAEALAKKTGLPLYSRPA